PANLLAVPAAGPVMVWGMTAGVAAGFLPAPAATVLHLPTRVLVGWIAGVAGVAARLPLGSVSIPALATVVAAVLVAGRVGRWRRPALGAAALALVGPLTLSALLPGREIGDLPAAGAT